MDSVSNFSVTDAVKVQLDLFRNLPGTALLNELICLLKKWKDFLGYNGNNILIQAIDFSYHTVLQFHLGNFKDVRGYLDTIIVGESRVGKSSTANTLRREYGLGIFTSLLETVQLSQDLLAVANKTATGFQTRAGVIPQNNRGLVIFEEFGKMQTRYCLRTYRHSLFKWGTNRQSQRNNRFACICQNACPIQSKDHRRCN